RWLAQTRVTASRISCRSGAYCADRSRSGTLTPATGDHGVDVTSTGIPQLYPAALDGCAGLALRFAALDGLALVEQFLALGQRDRHFDAALPEVHPQRDDRQPLFGGLAQ